MSRTVEQIDAEAKEQVGNDSEPAGDTEGSTGSSDDLTREISRCERAEKALLMTRQRHRVLIESLPIGLFRKDIGLEGKFQLVNQALVEMFGYDSREEFVQADMADFCEDPGDWNDFYDELISCGKVIAKEIRLKKKDGTALWGAFTASVVFSASGDSEYINGLIEDITERKLLESQLGQAQKLEAMGQLAAGVAHEINSPIQYVGDNTRFVQESVQDLVALLRRYDEVLKEADVDQEILQRLEAAAKEADLDYLVQEIPSAITQSLEGVDRVVSIVRAMKEFAHPDTHKKAPTDLAKVVESTVTLARNEWKYVAEMHMDFDPDLPPVPLAIGDFKQVILNLIINAAHAIEDVLGERPEGKGAITVSTARKGDSAEIRISDTGGGIPAEIRSKIFELFFTTKEVGKGTGQGLAISRAVIVEKHGGTIEFETELGKGTTFIIRIPIDPAPTLQERVGA